MSFYEVSPGKKIHILSFLDDIQMVLMFVENTDNLNKEVILYIDNKKWVKSI